jgi:glyoxylase-like metal-dependent hydrolase (beta-lactamase superfamily II)
MPLFEIGVLQVDRVEEFGGPNVRVEDFMVGVPEGAIERNLDWLAPDCYDIATGQLVTTVQSWVVRTPHHVVLIDTCCGNHKVRPKVPPMHQLNTPWLQRLADKGIRADQVDYVMCTHLHADHVGWNTQLVDGRWVPTFPNARYLFGRREYEHWNPAAEGATGYGQDGVFEDSVLPCMLAGLATLVDDGYTLDDALQVEAAPGHSAGNSIIRARSGGATGLFTGDCIHTPLQLAYPDVNSAACEDQVQARATRRRILSECAERGHLLIPTHFPAPFVARITPQGDAFKYHAGFSSVGHLI